MTKCLAIKSSRRRTQGNGRIRRRCGWPIQPRSAAFFGRWGWSVAWPQRADVVRGRLGALRVPRGTRSSPISLPIVEPLRQKEQRKLEEEVAEQQGIVNGAYLKNKERKCEQEDWHDDCLSEIEPLKGVDRKQLIEYASQRQIYDHCNCYRTGCLSDPAHQRVIYGNGFGRQC